MKVGSSISVATLPQRPPATEHEPIKRLTQVQFQWQQLNLPQTTAAVAVAAGAAATAAVAVAAAQTNNSAGFAAKDAGVSLVTVRKLSKSFQVK